jgi:dipeptidyl aminopeptidase/acylaminoacyl peptidase
MKLKLLFLLISFLCLIACQKSDNTVVQTNNSAHPSKEKKKKSDLKLAYLQELDSQKSNLNDKNKYWTARAILTDAEEKILDLDTSSDSKWLLYVTRGKETSYIYVLDTETGAMPRMLYKDDRSISWARFNETNEKVLFSISEEKGNYFLCTIEVNKPVFQLPEKADFSLTGNIDICSINSQKIIALTYGEALINDAQGFPNLKGETTIELKKDDIIFKTLKKARAPSWSNNGRSLLFITEMFGQPEIAKWDIDEPGIQRISISKGGNNNPRFSPNNERIIYSSNESGKFNIYHIGLKDLVKKRVTNMRDMEFFKPVWCSNGKIYAIGLKQKTSFLFQFKIDEKMSQVSINGEPGPDLTKMSSPAEQAEIDIGKE